MAALGLLEVVKAGHILCYQQRESGVLGTEELFRIRAAMEGILALDIEAAVAL